MARKPTVVTLVIDAVGIPTLEYLLDKYSGKFTVPHLESMGLGNLLNEKHHSRVRPVTSHQLAYAITQASAEADSVVGHREIVGVVDSRKYELFFNGFSPEYIDRLEQMIRRKTIFNQMAGGEEAIEKNREEHERTGHPIVYASVCDPLIQIAMHEDLIPVSEAHHITDVAFQLAREMGIQITRSIGRTYIVRDGEVVRTNNRHDAVLPLDGPTLIDVLYEAGVTTVSVGKPAELVPSYYWSSKVKLADPSQLNPTLGLRFIHPKGKDTNPYSIQGAVNALREVRGLSRGAYLFVNCVDTDSLWGHTQKVVGSLDAIQEVDRCIPLLLDEMERGDILIVTADHGMLHAGDRVYHQNLDPRLWNYGYHSNEAVPLLAMRKEGEMSDFRLATAKTFASVGHLVAQAFGITDRFIDECALNQYFRA